MASVELSAQELATLFRELGEIQTHLSNLGKNVERLTEEAAATRRTDWKGILTATAAILGVLLTVMMTVGALAIDHAVDVAMGKNNLLYDAKLDELKQEAERFAINKVNELVGKLNKNDADAAAGHDGGAGQQTKGKR